MLELGLLSRQLAVRTFRRVDGWAFDRIKHAGGVALGRLDCWVHMGVAVNRIFLDIGGGVDLGVEQRQMVILIRIGRQGERLDVFCPLCRDLGGYNGNRSAILEGSLDDSFSLDILIVYLCLRRR